MKNARALEILLMPGFVMAAIPFAGPLPLPVLLGKGLELFTASLLLVISVYATNTYFGFETDKSNSRLRPLQRGSKRHFALTAAGTLLLSLLVFWHIKPLLLLPAGLSFVLWAAYSVPGGAKTRPVWGTAVHFFTQILQFHLGILAFSGITVNTVCVSVFFACLFSSGHLMHEVKDHESDRAAGIRTNAVVFGPKKIVRFYKRALIVPPLYWAGLFASGMIGASQFFPFFLATACHAGLGWFWDEGALENNEAFQRIYRALYLSAGVLTVILTRNY